LEHWTSKHVTTWLANSCFASYTSAFSGLSGAHVAALSKEDFVEKIEERGGVYLEGVALYRELQERKGTAIVNSSGPVISHSFFFDDRAS